MTTFEVAIDNERVQVHCHEAPVDPWTCFDLSTAIPFKSRATQNWVPLDTPMAIWNAAAHEMDNNPDWGTTVTFSMPGFTLDPSKTYQFRATYATTGNQFGIMQQNPDWVAFNDNYELGFTFPTANEIFLTVGPGVDQWDAAIAAGYQSLVRFDTATALIKLCYKEVTP